MNLRDVQRPGNINRLSLGVYTHTDEGRLRKCGQHSLFKWLDSTFPADEVKYFSCFLAARRGSSQCCVLHLQFRSVSYNKSSTKLQPLIQPIKPSNA